MACSPMGLCKVYSSFNFLYVHRSCPTTWCFHGTDHRSQVLSSSPAPCEVLCWVFSSTLGYFHRGILGLLLQLRALPDSYLFKSSVLRPLPSPECAVQHSSRLCRSLSTSTCYAASPHWNGCASILGRLSLPDSCLKTSYLRSDIPMRVGGPAPSLRSCPLFKSCSVLCQGHLY